MNLFSFFQAHARMNECEMVTLSKEDPDVDWVFVRLDNEFVCGTSELGDFEMI